MRSTYRLFMAAVLLTLAAGVSVASAQNAGPAPPAAKPAAELPPIPMANPLAPAIAPALAADPAPPTVEPVAAAVVDQSAELKPVTTTARQVAKKAHTKPAVKPAKQVTDSFQTTAPAASVAVVEAAANTAPPDAAANTTHPAAVAARQPAPAPAPALKPASVETSSEVTTSARRMGLGGWLLFGIAVVVLFGGITVIRRRRAQSHRQPSIVDFTPVSPALDPVLVPRR